MTVFWTNENGVLGLVCSAHTGPDRNWCNHISDYVTDKKDANEIAPADTYRVPIAPSQGIFAIVKINDPLSPKIHAAEMNLKHTPDIGSSFIVSLGLWNPGESLLVIRGVIFDYIKSKAHPDEVFHKDGPVLTPCPNNIHSFNATVRLTDETWSAAWRAACIWNIVMEKACTFCLEESGGSDGNFGIDPQALRNDPRPISRPAAGGPAMPSPHQPGWSTGGVTNSAGTHQQGIQVNQVNINTRNNAQRIAQEQLIKEQARRMGRMGVARQHELFVARYTQGGHLA